MIQIDFYFSLQVSFSSFIILITIEGFFVCVMCLFIFLIKFTYIVNAATGKEEDLMRRSIPH